VCEVSKILTPKKKKIKVPAQNIPQKYVNFPLTPHINPSDKRMPTGLTTQKRLWGHPSEKIIHTGCVGIKWNGPMANSLKCSAIQHTLHIKNIEWYNHIINNTEGTVTTYQYNMQ
jgi:hypothetical protein